MSKDGTRPRARREGRWGRGRLPLPPGLRGYRRAWLGPDLLAGLTLAAVAIPECMGYTKIAGTPVVTGLYTILLPLAAFALLGASRHLARRHRLARCRLSAHHSSPEQAFAPHR